MFNIKVFDKIPHMTYEEHNELVQLELLNYYSNVLNERIPANEYEMKFADDCLDLLMSGADTDIVKYEEKARKITDDYVEHADFARMRHYLTPIVLSFLAFPDYDEETNNALGRFFEERYPEHAKSNQSKNNENK